MRFIHAYFISPSLYRTMVELYDCAVSDQCMKANIVVF